MGNMVAEVWSMLEEFGCIAQSHLGLKCANIRLMGLAQQFSLRNVVFISSQPQNPFQHPVDCRLKPSSLWRGQGRPRAHSKQKLAEDQGVKELKSLFKRDMFVGQNLSSHQLKCCTCLSNAVVDLQGQFAIGWLLCSQMFVDWGAV